MTSLELEVEYLDRNKTFEDMMNLSDRKKDDVNGQKDVDSDVEETIFLEELQEERLTEAESTDFHESSSFSTFSVLPDELLICIFSYLTPRQLCTTVALVCKEWLGYSRNPLLWQRLTLEETTCFASLEELSVFIQRHCPYLKHLTLRHTTDLNLHDCRVIAQSCPMLQSLSLSFCAQVNKDVIKQFSTFCPNLCEIDLEGCASVSDECLQPLAKLPLKKLNAAHCTHLTNDGLKFLSRKCNKLQNLNFDGIQWITSDAIRVMVENCHRRIHHLWLDGEDMVDDTVEMIARCSYLQSFGLSFCDSLTDLSLVWVRNMRNLVSVKLTKGSNFSAAALKELFEHLHPKRTGSATGLLHVSIAECASLNDKGVEALADSCRNLLTLNISWCWNVSDVGLDHVINKCHRLVDLNICGSKDLEGNPLRKIPQMLPGLRRLNATQCNLVPDELLADLASTMQKLIVVDYYGQQVLVTDTCTFGSGVETNGWLMFAY